VGSVLVIGYGSIGSRHARIAAELGHRVEVVSRRGETDSFPHHPSIASALASSTFGAVIIATETAQHRNDLKTLDDTAFDGRVLVEKPIFACAGGTPLSASLRSRTWVAYNLRLHPVLLETKRRLAGVRALNASCYVGQDLTQWRTGRPVGDTYSSSRAGGGGVLRDLSHELDYLVWLFGPWSSVSAIGGRVSQLEGDADDCWAVALRFDSGTVVSMGLDYFSRKPVRRLLINTTTETLDGDLVASRLTSGDERTWPIERDHTYRRQLTELLDETRPPSLCHFDEGIEIVRLIEAIEESAALNRTVFA